MWKQLKRKPVLDLPLQCLWAKWSIPSQLGSYAPSEPGSILLWAKSTPGVHDAWHPSLLCCGDIREGPSFDCVAMETFGCAFYCKRITTEFRNLGLFSCVVCSQQSSLPISVLPSAIYSSEFNDGPLCLLSTSLRMRQSFTCQAGVSIRVCVIVSALVVEANEDHFWFDNMWS